MIGNTVVLITGAELPAACRYAVTIYPRYGRLTARFTRLAATGFFGKPEVSFR